MNSAWLRLAVVSGILICFASTSYGQLLRGRPRQPAAGEQGREPRAPRRPLLRGVVDRITDAVDNEATAGEATPSEDAARPNLLDSLLPFLNGAANQAEPLDTVRLNEAIEEGIATPLVEEIEPLESLEFRFDPKHTDFGRDRLGIFGGMRLRSTPWHAPAELGLHLHASVEPRHGQGPRAVVSADIDLLTDTVAMFESARRMTMQQLRGRADISPEEAETLALLEITPPLHTLTDVADFLPRLGEINLRNANHKVQALKSRLAHARDLGEERHLIDELARAYRDRDNLLAFSIRPHRNSRLQVDQIEINLPGGGVSYKMADVESVHLLITPGSLQGQVSLSFGQAAVVFYRGAKAVILEPALRRIQQRDPATLDSLRDRGRLFSEELELSPRRDTAIEDPTPEELPLPGLE